MCGIHYVLLQAPCCNEALDRDLLGVEDFSCAEIAAKPTK